MSKVHKIVMVVLLLAIAGLSTSASAQNHPKNQACLGGIAWQQNQPSPESTSAKEWVWPNTQTPRLLPFNPTVPNEPLVLCVILRLLLRETRYAWLLPNEPMLPPGWQQFITPGKPVNPFVMRITGNI